MARSVGRALVEGRLPEGEIQSEDSLIGATGVTTSRIDLVNFRASGLVTDSCDGKSDHEFLILAVPPIEDHILLQRSWVGASAHERARRNYQR